jgi:hypothetical protein
MQQIDALPCGEPEVMSFTSEDMPHADYYGAKVLKCRKCGGKSFEVASGDYTTLIQCVVCRVPSMVHYG